VRVSDLCFVIADCRSSDPMYMTENPDPINVVKAKIILDE